MGTTVAGHLLPRWLWGTRQRATQWPAPMKNAAYYLWLVADGDRPRVVSTLSRRLLSRHPVTYRQKMMYKLSRDRRPILTTMADKVAVRAYVRERAGERWLKQAYAVADRASEIPWEVLPKEVVFKVNHGSSGAVIVAQHADPRTELPDPKSKPGWTRFVVHPDSVTPEQIGALLDYWLGLRYGYCETQSPEWAYTGIRPQILVEELIRGSGPGLPEELWMHCFDGEVAQYLVVGRSDTFDEVDLHRFMDDEAEQARNACGLDDEVWDAVVEASRRLSAETDSLRVDWLLSDRGPLLAELTNYPGAGRLEFNGHAFLSPQQVHEQMTSRWDVPARYV